MASGPIPDAEGNDVLFEDKDEHGMAASLAEGYAIYLMEFDDDGENMMSVEVGC